MTFDAYLTTFSPHTLHSIYFQKFTSIFTETHGNVIFPTKSEKQLPQELKRNSSGFHFILIYFWKCTSFFTETHGNVRFPHKVRETITTAIEKELIRVSDVIVQD